MMKAEELRIGNYIYPGNSVHENEIVTVIGIGTEELRFISKNILGQEYRAAGTVATSRGIPITEDWLKNMGFIASQQKVSCDQTELSGGNEYVNNGECVIVNQDKFYFIRDESENSQDGSTYYRYRQIDYVHQLQNIYFALDGQELILPKQ